MAETAVPNTAVQIVARAIFVHPELPQNQADSCAAVAALASAGWLREPAEVERRVLGACTETR